MGRGRAASGPCIKGRFVCEAGYRSLLHNHSGTMSLSAKDKAAVKDFWAKVAPKAEDIGNDALYR